MPTYHSIYHQTRKRRVAKKHRNRFTRSVNIIARQMNGDVPSCGEANSSMIPVWSDWDPPQPMP
jgi:hypothetical protein